MATTRVTGPSNAASLLPTASAPAAPAKIQGPAFREVLSGREPAPTTPSSSVGFAEAMSRGLRSVGAADDRLERAVRQARRGASLDNAQLIALQADVYRAVQQIDLCGKLVDRTVSGLKQVLQTQV